MSIPIYSHLKQSNYFNIIAELITFKIIINQICRHGFRWIRKYQEGYLLELAIFYIKPQILITTQKSRLFSSKCAVSVGSMYIVHAGKIQSTDIIPLKLGFLFNNIHFILQLY